MPKPPELFACTERVPQAVQSTGGDVHPGWVRATAILLRGLARLEALENEHGSSKTPDDETG